MLNSISQNTSVCAVQWILGLILWWNVNYFPYCYIPLSLALSTSPYHSYISHNTVWDFVWTHPAVGRKSKNNSYNNAVQREQEIPVEPEQQSHLHIKCNRLKSIYVCVSGDFNSSTTTFWFGFHLSVKISEFNLKALNGAIKYWTQL